VESIGSVALGFLAFLLLVILLAVGAYVRHRLRGALLLRQIRATWPSGKVALLAYTKNRKWSPYIDERILPEIEKCTVVVDRTDAQWKERHPLEEKVIRHWAGRREYNPVVIAFIPKRKPQVFRFYEAFQDTRRGHTADLERQTVALLALLKPYADRPGNQIAGADA
jgi:hypothetical protein